MSFAAGFSAGSSMAQRALDARDAREAREAEMRIRQAAEARAQQEHEYTQGLRREEGDAITELRGLQRGVVTQQGTGMTNESAQMLNNQGYGGASGTGAIRAAATDNALEERRLGLPRTAAPSADIQTRQATDAETTSAAQRVALARRDMSSWSQLETKRRDDQLKTARRDEFQRISKLPPEELVSGFHASVNDNPNAPFMVDFDKKSNKYMLVSRMPGIPSQTLSRAEMTQAMMGMWEAGNGDYDKGMQAMISAAQNQRTMQNQDFERSSTLARGNADLYFKGRNADNDDARTRNDSTRLGIYRKSVEDRAQQERMGAARVYKNEKGEYVEMYPVTTKNGIDWREVPVPAGMKPVRLGAERAGPDRKAPEAGSVMTRADGSRYRADGNGGELDVRGVMPDQRTSVLSKAGLAKDQIDQLAWHPSGLAVVFNGEAYPVNDPKMMEALKADMRENAAYQIELGEDSTRGVSHGVPTYGRGAIAPRYPAPSRPTQGRGLSGPMPQPIQYQR